MWVAHVLSDISSDLVQVSQILLFYSVRKHISLRNIKKKPHVNFWILLIFDHFQKLVPKVSEIKRRWLAWRWLARRGTQSQSRWTNIQNGCLKALLHHMSWQQIFEIKRLIWNILNWSQKEPNSTTLGIKTSTSWWLLPGTRRFNSCVTPVPPLTPGLFICFSDFLGESFLKITIYMTHCWNRPLQYGEIGWHSRTIGVDI